MRDLKLRYNGQADEGELHEKVQEREGEMERQNGSERKDEG